MTMLAPIEEAISRFRPVKNFAMFSGGNDSLCATHYSMEHGAHEVFHIRTGIGLTETTDFVIETCRKYGWPLVIKDPPDLSYEDMVLKFGFPGPGAHIYPYSWLKERAIRELVRETKRRWRDKVGLFTGVRNRESARRMGFVKPALKEDARIWFAPCFYMDTIDQAAYIAAHRLETNPVIKIVGFSGECFCGAFAQQPPDVELSILQKFFPYLYRRIMDLQERARAVGVHSKWGVRPPDRNDDQYDLPFMPACANCMRGLR